jgi:FkbM family methyltransferase
MRRWIKIGRKAVELIWFLGLISSLKVIFYRLMQPSGRLLIKTRIGNVLIRLKGSDLKVLHSSAVDEYPYLARVCSPGAVFYDFGGYTGISGLSANFFLKPKKIKIFEPVRENYELLEKNVEILDDVEIFKFGLGEFESYHSASSQAGQEWAWTVMDPGEKTGAILEEQVVLKPLSQIGLMPNEFNIAKFDIEGSEIYLTSENNFSILKLFDVIIIEFHESLAPGITSKLSGMLSETHCQEILGDEKVLFTKK